MALWNFTFTGLLDLTNKLESRVSSIVYDGLADNVTQLFIIFCGNQFTFAPKFDTGCILLALLDTSNCGNQRTLKTTIAVDELQHIFSG